MSFGRRIELVKRVRDLVQRAEYFQAGSQPSEKLEGGLLAAEIDKVYLEWGLQSICGLEIDGSAATVDTLIAAGPELLCREIVSAIKAECGLTEEERKN
jgi:hypothetical protein